MRSILNFTNWKCHDLLSFEWLTENFIINVENVVWNKTTNDFVIFSINVSVIEKRFQIIAKNQFIINDRIEISKNAFDDNAMRFREIEWVTIDNENDENYIESNIKHNIHEKINDELISFFKFDKCFVIVENKLQMQIRIHENVVFFEFIHLKAIKNKTNIIMLTQTNNAINTIANNFQTQIIIAKIHVNHVKFIVEMNFQLDDNVFVDINK